MIAESELKPFGSKRIYLSTSSIEGNCIVGNEGFVSYANRPRQKLGCDPNTWQCLVAKMKDSIKVYLAKEDDDSKYILSTGFYGLVPKHESINSKWLSNIFSCQIGLIRAKI
jgi:hypothetical protein